MSATDNACSLGAGKQKQGGWPTSTTNRFSQEVTRQHRRAAEDDSVSRIHCYSLATVVNFCGNGFEAPLTQRLELKA